jgi:DNA processing protein
MTTAAIPNELSVPAITEERIAWLALTLTPHLGLRRILRAFERCESAAKSSSEVLLILRLWSSLSKCAVYRRWPRTAADQQLDALIKTGAQLLTYTDDAYPERLREIFDPPALLWLRDNPQVLALPSIAVVGTRHHTPYGTGMAEMLSRDLAHRGLIILSGMARVVDTSAHKGALAAKHPAIAVWGTG